MKNGVICFEILETPYTAENFGNFFKERVNYCRNVNFTGEESLSTIQEYIKKRFSKFFA